MIIKNKIKSWQILGKGLLLQNYNLKWSTPLSPDLAIPTSLCYFIKTASEAVELNGAQFRFTQCRCSLMLNKCKAVPEHSVGATIDIWVSLLTSMAAGYLLIAVVSLVSLCIEMDQGTSQAGLLLYGFLHIVKIGHCVMIAVLLQYFIFCLFD